MAHALVAEPVNAQIDAMRLRFRRKLGRVFESIIEQGLRDGDFVRQDVPAAAACIVGSIFEGLLAHWPQMSSSAMPSGGTTLPPIVAFCLRGALGSPAAFTPPKTTTRRRGKRATAE